MKKIAVLILFFSLAASALTRNSGQMPKTNIPNYSQSERSAVPEAFRWRLEDIYPTPEAWEQDKAEAQRGLDRLDSLLKKGAATPKTLTDCLELHQQSALRLEKLQGYAAFQSQVQWQNARFRDMQSEAGRLQTALNAQSAVLDARILRIDENRMEELYRTEPRLIPYRIYLTKVGQSRSHRLSSEAARIASQTEQFSDGPKIAAECLRNLDMPRPEAVLPDGTKLLLTGPNRRKLSRSADPAERRAADEASALNRKHYENTFAALLDASVKRDVFQASIHRFPDCLSAEFQPYGVPPAVYRNMVQTVRGNLEPYHRFLRLRKKILGLTELHPYDADLPTVPGADQRFSFAEARRLVEESLRPLGTEYAGLARRAFDERWIDVYAHKDKMNLGSAQSLKGVHPFINLDFRGSYFDLITVSHELGHALSFYLAEKSQPFAASNIVWFASEIPSTFHEILLMNHLLDQAGDDRLKLALLSQFIERLDILFFFSARHAELQSAIHDHVEQGGTLTPAWLNAKQLELARHYLGHDRGAMVVDEYVQSDWNHPNTYFAPFQSYYYVIGSAVSLALADKVRAGGEAAGKYVAFLKSGESRPILDVMREMGIDLSTPQPFLDALAAFDRLVERMERLQARLK
jgi:oligoendopeptidase F